MSLTGKTKASTYKDLLEIDNSNNGVDATTRAIKSGEGTSSSLSISTTKVLVKPSADSTTTVDFQDTDGNSKFVFDSTNDLVKALGHNVNTQYAYFGHGETGSALFAANTHYAIPFGTTIGTGGYFTIGTGTNPDTSYTISSTGAAVATCLWHIIDNITIDSVSVWNGSDAASGDTLRFHLMSYDIDSSNGTTSGDLSNGTVLADGADITSAGYEQSYYQSMIIQSANVNAGKVVLFLFRQDGTNGDYASNVTVKYHLR